MRGPRVQERLRLFDTRHLGLRFNTAILDFARTIANLRLHRPHRTPPSPPQSPLVSPLSPPANAHADPSAVLLRFRGGRRLSHHDGCLRLLQTIVKKNPRHHDKREQHVGLLREHCRKAMFLGRCKREKPTVAGMDARTSLLERAVAIGGGPTARSLTTLCRHRLSFNVIEGHGIGVDVARQIRHRILGEMRHNPRHSSSSPPL